MSKVGEGFGKVTGAACFLASSQEGSLFMATQSGLLLLSAHMMDWDNLSSLQAVSVKSNKCGLPACPIKRSLTLQCWDLAM